MINTHLSDTASQVAIYNISHHVNLLFIREEDIGSNTSNRFIDTLNICNLQLKAIGGDYDGER